MVMGIFGDLFDDVADLVSDVTDPVAEVAKDAAATVGLETRVDLMDLAVLATLLGLEVAVVKAALAAGCGTVGEVKDWANTVGDGGTFGGGGGDV